MSALTNLLTLRRLVARRLGDYYGDPTGGGTAATPTTGGTNNIKDTGRTESNGFFNGAYFVGKVGSGSPVYGRVATYTSSTQNFALQAALSSSCTTNDNYELYRLFSPAEYHAAINEAIRTVAHVCRTEQTPDTSLTIVTNQTEYSIPSTFNTVYRVSVEDPTYTGIFYPLSPTDWDVLPGSATLVLNPEITGLVRFSTVTTTRRIRLEGEANITANLAAETDTTLAPAQFVVPYAAAWLLEQVSQGKQDRQGREEHIQRFLLAAQAARAELAPVIRHANNRRVKQP